MRARLLLITAGAISGAVVVSGCGARTASVSWVRATVQAFPATGTRADLPSRVLSPASAGSGTANLRLGETTIDDQANRGPNGPLGPPPINGFYVEAELVVNAVDGPVTVDPAHITFLSDGRTYKANNGNSLRDAFSFTDEDPTPARLLHRVVVPAGGTVDVQVGFDVPTNTGTVSVSLTGDRLSATWAVPPVPPNAVIGATPPASTGSESP